MTRPPQLTTALITPPAIRRGGVLVEEVVAEQGSKVLDPLEEEADVVVAVEVTEDVGLAAVAAMLEDHTISGR